MGKNKRRQLLAIDDVHNMQLSVDSQEEIDCLAWLCEAQKSGIINDFTYQPKSFKLFDAAKYQDITNKTRSLFREHEYTADFVMSLDPNKWLDLSKELKISYSELSNNICSVFIDCKGTFNKTERAFGYNQKWLWQKFKTYVYKLVPKDFFKRFGVPMKCVLTNKTKKPRKMFEGMKSLKDITSFK